VDVYCLPFPRPHLNLNMNTKRADVHNRYQTSWQRENGLTVPCWPLGLGNEAGRLGNGCSVGVEGWKLAAAGPAARAQLGADSSSL
jgi:hypothetical protein